MYYVVPALLAGDTDKLYASTDGGRTFLINAYGLFQTVYFRDVLNGYLVGINGEMWHTMNGARTWNPMGTGTNRNLTDVFFPTSLLGFIVGENGTLRRTTNGGVNWQAVNSVTTATLQAIYFTSASTGYAVGAGGVALRTQNGGTTWVQMNVNTTTVLRDVYFKNSSIGYIVGDAGTILATSDGGNTWNSQPSNTFESLNAIASVPQTSRIWAVGGAGLILAHDSNVMKSASSAALATTAVSPNPFATEIRLDFPAGVEVQSSYFG